MSCLSKAVTVELSREGLGQVRQPVLALCCFSKVSLCRGAGEGNGTNHLFLPQRGSSFLLLSGKASHKSKGFPIMHHRHFFRSLFSHCLFPGCSRQASTHWALSQSGQLTFHIPNFKDMVWWGSMLVSGKGSHCARTGASLSWKGSYARAQGQGIWKKVG